jgi:hypothetical protein
MDEKFSKDEFETMKPALDATWGAYLYLRDDAPSPQVLKNTFTEIYSAAIVLYNALIYFWDYTGKDNEDEDKDKEDENKNNKDNKDNKDKDEADRDIRREPHVRYAASRVMRRVRFPHMAAQDDHHEAIYDYRFDDFEQMLSEVIKAAQAELKAVELATDDERSRKVVSERGTAHLLELLFGLQSIAKWHGWQLKYTRSTYEDVEPLKSPLADLTMILAKKLPKEARPKSIRTILRLMLKKRGDQPEMDDAPDDSAP